MRAASPDLAASGTDSRLDPRDWRRVYASQDSGDGLQGFREVAIAALALCRRYRHPKLPWLDVGCGTGDLLSQLADGAGPAVFGLDRDAAMLDFARQAPAALLRGDALRLPVADDSLGGLSAVSFSGCLAEPRDFFREVARTLAPGGIVVVSFTNAQALGVRRFDARRHSQTGESIPQRRGRYRRYRIEEAQGLLRDAGLALTETRFTSAFIEARGHLLPNLALARRLPKLLPAAVRIRLCANFLLVARA
ncbi:MAG: methyltransferase domain-containing protein [Gammaproteobacteria bacterium]|nr:methyltransferase domain-containing protein [Gammaproteobacteria bacterium]